MDFTTDLAQMRSALVTFFDNSFIQATEYYTINQPYGVDLTVRNVSDQEMVVFVKYQGRRIPDEIWEGMNVIDPITHQPVDCRWDIINPELVFDSTVIHVRGCNLDGMYRIELERPYSPTPASRSDFHGAD